METKDWIMVIAVILGPILAVQVQKRLEVLRERRNRKLQVFQDIMATRAARVSAEHVKALNMIDIEFYGSKRFGIRQQSKPDKAVINAWRNYQDHLNNRLPDDNITWFTKGDDLFTELLFQMSKALDYDFDMVLLKRGCYSPIAHGEIEMDQQTIRKGLVKILSGENPLLIAIPSTEHTMGDTNQIEQSENPTKP